MISIQNLIDEVCLNYYKVAAQKNMEVLVTFPYFNINVFVDKKLFKKTIGNIVEKVIELSDKDECIKVVVVLSDKLYIKIKGYGIDVSEGNLSHFLYGTDIGKILEVHYFSIAITSEINVFTEVVIAVPKAFFDVKILH